MKQFSESCSEKGHLRSVYIKNEVAFAFCHLLGFQLMPRLKNIYAQKLARPVSGDPEAYPNLQLILSRPIDWDLIKEQYDQMIKYATALRRNCSDLPLCDILWT